MDFYLYVLIQGIIWKPLRNYGFQRFGKLMLKMQRVIERNMANKNA